MINRIQNKRFCLHRICIYFVYLLCIYKYTPIHVYIFKKNMLRLFIIYIIYDKSYINVNFSKYVLYVCVFIYIHNKYTQYTHIYYLNKTFILDSINHD